ncbi:hypothetical protein ACH4NC_33885 [Streptomyces sp. NPDC017201]|uniref:hypothetical protein n=1 Tax=unclassified Streptomyces TaxID=2593676 RepID=UPI0037A6134B
MSVSLYYSASRAMPATDAERAAVERIVAAHMESFPYEDEESLHLYASDDSHPDEVVAGSTKSPACAIRTSRRSRAAAETRCALPRSS